MSAPNTLPGLAFAVALVAALAACSAVVIPTNATLAPTFTATSGPTDNPGPSASPTSAPTAVAPTVMAAPTSAIAQHMTRGGATVSFEVDGVGDLQNAAPLVLETKLNPTIYPNNSMAMTWDLTVGDTIPATLYLYFQADPTGRTDVEAGDAEFLLGSGDLAISVAPVVRIAASGTIGADDYLQDFDTYGSGVEATYPVPQPQCGVTMARTSTGGVTGAVVCRGRYTGNFGPAYVGGPTEPYQATASFWAEP